MATDDDRPLTSSDKLLLLQLARKSIQSHFEGKSVHEPDVPDHLRAKRGVFVTLKIDDDLRGCIGNIFPIEPLFRSVMDHAINAAFRDPRFHPLTLSEFSEVDIEVSVLSVPKPLSFRSPSDLLDVLRPDIDGVILSKGRFVSTFLPQVWGDLPDPAEFLEHLSIKAGLPADAWKDSQIQTYQAVHFSEPEIISTR